jgi:acylphosphatase
MSEEQQIVTAYVQVKGRVQGVGFRQFVAHWARKHRVSGWIRNREDGTSVELLAEGDTDDVKALLERVNTGPPGSRIDQMEVEWISSRALQEPFEIRR